jgi:cold shock protein
MAIGKVKWFNNEKKYGFILIGEREVFVHFSAILKEGYKTLKKGQTVECDLVKGPRGERAINVKKLALPDLQGTRGERSSKPRSFLFRPHLSN